MKLYKLLVPVFCGLVSARLTGIPTVPYEEGDDDYDLSSIKAIAVDKHYADAVDDDGLTEIPPTLKEFAETFSSDLLSQVRKHKIPVIEADEAPKDSIFLTIDEDGDYKTEAGEDTSEGYSIEVKDDGVVIKGSSPLGAWWGTRTVLQQAVLGNNSIKHGKGKDAPGWKDRGAFLDAGRHYYPPEFLVEFCSYLSYFKQNYFHVHLSDNLYNNVDIYTKERQMELYAAFRLDSDDPAVEGLNKRLNESYTKDQFESVQQKCAQRGVTIVPEIESPAHALVFSQWKPELGLDEDLSMLNISHPDTIPTMQKVWKTFLPWFHSKVVHIGADEYIETLPNDYAKLVNSLNRFIGTESGKFVRIWGTFPPNASADAVDVDKNVSIQHWENFEDNAYFDFIKNGYDVLNSDDSVYTVNKWSESYRQQIDLNHVFHGDPKDNQSAFYPNIYDSKNATNNPPKDNKRILGEVMAMWNDFGPNTTTYNEAFFVYRDGLPALGDKQWGGDLTFEEYNQVFEKLEAEVPGQNLDRRVDSKGETILKYDFCNTKDKKVRDSSGNNYDGELSGAEVKDDALVLDGNGCLKTPLSSKGRNYTLSFDVKPESKDPGTLFDGKDSTLLNGNGTSPNITMVAAGNAFALNYSLPVNEWTHAKLIGRGNQTFFAVNDKPEMEFLTKIGWNGVQFVWSEMAFEAPLETIGEGFKGQIKNIELKSTA